jgi:hypothetical protein
MKYFLGYCLIISLFSCTEAISVKNESIPQEESVNMTFSDWLEIGTKHSIHNDTIYSNPDPRPKNCENTLPGVKNFYGFYFSHRGQESPNSHHFMINSYMVDSLEFLYLEVFNDEGRRIFSRSVFDYEYIKRENHFSRLYQSGRYFIFENCINQNGEEEIITTRKIDIYSMIDI